MTLHHPSFHYLLTVLYITLAFTLSSYLVESRSNIPTEILSAHRLLNLRNTMTDSIVATCRLWMSVSSTLHPQLQSLTVKACFTAVVTSPYATRRNSPDPIHGGDSLEAHLPSPPTMTTIVFTTLKHLPAPLPVLPLLQRIVLTNEAMGWLLGIDLVNAAVGIERLPSITDILQGRKMPQLGIDILQDGSPICLTRGIGED